MSSEHQTANNETRPKRRGCRRVFGISLIVLIILLPLLNGPIFRKVAHSQLENILHDLYLEGDFKVEGSILGGAELHDVNLTGSRNLQSLTLSKAELSYSLPRLVTGKWGESITKIHLHDSHVRYNTAKDLPTDPKVEKRKSAKQEKKLAKEKNSTVWENLDALLQQDITIENFNLTISSPEKQVFNLDNFKLKLLNGSGSITANKITYPNGDETKKLQANLECSGEKIIEITSLALAEDFNINRLTINKPTKESVLTQAPRLSGSIQFLGGQITAEQTSQTTSHATLNSGKIDLSALDNWLPSDLGIAGRISRLDVSFDSEAPHPIHADITTDGFTYKKYSTDRIEASIDYRQDEVKVESLNIDVGDNSVKLTGTYLPDSKQLAAQADVKTPDLQQLADRYELPNIGGALTGNIDLKVTGKNFAGTEAQLTGSDLFYDVYSLAKTELSTTATQNGALAFKLKSSVDPEGTNTINAEGTFDSQTKSLQAKPVIAIADLAKLTRLVPDAPALKGSLNGNGVVQLIDGKLTSTTFTINAQDMAYKGATLSSLRANGKTTVPNQLDFDLSTSIDAANANTISTNGTINLDTLQYDSTASLKLPNLATLHPLLAAAEVEQRPSGKLHLAWTGTGDIKEKKHRGSATVSDFSVKLEANDSISGKLNANYGQDTYHITNLNVRSGNLSITGAAHLADKRLNVEALRLFNEEKSIVRANISIPFDQKNVSDLNTFLDQPGKVMIEVESDKLKLSELLSMTGKPAKLGALIDANIDIKGTLADPTGTGDLNIMQLRDLQSADLAPADIDLNFKLDRGQLVVDGGLKHPEIEAITIKGNTPLRLKKLGAISDQSINLALKLPETDLSIAKKYVPSLTSATGKLSVDVKITGTASEPNLAGDIFIKAQRLKWQEQKIPTLSDMDIAIHLKGKRLHIKKCSGYIAGGRIDIGGNADFDTLANPNLDLSLSAKQALLFRDDSVSLRANANIKLAGPYDKAAISGKVGVTQSRYFREIEILPIGLPRSSPTPAAPRAPSFGSKKEIGVSATPFKDWTVDVQVVTDDPFLVRSNLARADIVSDIIISGTLGKPIPRGSITLDKGKATLPFSELATTQGALTFSETTGFDPEINLRAVSKVQDYQISLIAYGRSSAPKTLITSDPPLPETEALALLATGAKSTDLNNGEVIAGDAALLLIDKLRRKYAKGTPLERHPGSLRELLDLKAGQIDPRTGKRAASAELEVTDSVYLLGNVDVEGEYRGLVKFIFRFK